MLPSQSTRPLSEKSSSYVNRIRPEQISTLEQEFAKARTLHNTDLELLAAEMGLDERDVQVSWHKAGVATSLLSIWCGKTL